MPTHDDGMEAIRIADARAAGGSDTHETDKAFATGMANASHWYEDRDAVYEFARSLERRLLEAEALVASLKSTIAKESLLILDALGYADSDPAQLSDPLESARAMRQRAERAEAALAILQHFVDCANTPLMRDVMRERDEAMAALADMKMQRDDLMSACTKENTRAEEAEAALKSLQYVRTKEAQMDADNRARADRAEAARAKARDEAPCRHEWYQGSCAHCAMDAATFRALKGTK